MLPVRRDYRFDLPRERLSDWHPAGPGVSHFFNALSLFFPPGERFFISSVRHYEQSIRDPELIRAVRGFIGQEAMHGREHQRYNQAMAAAGLPASALEHLVERLLAAAKPLAPKPFQLSLTIALEHFTAILADRLLADPATLGDCEEQFRRLWLWHAHEETEHKAVAFDVWSELMGRGAGARATRYAGMLVAGSAFAVLVTAFTAVLIERDRALSASSRRESYSRLAIYLLRPGGLLRAGGPAWLGYFRKDFHPWQHDNRRLLQKSATERPQQTSLAHAA